MKCKYCDHELPAGSNPRREFCNDAHKQAYYRQKHQADQSAALLTELSELRAKVADQAQTIEELEQQVTHLHSLLDIEKLLLADKKRSFKAWLKKQPSSPFIQKLLADPNLPTMDTYNHYQYRLRVSLRGTPEEQDELTRLWKLMVLS